MVKGRVAGESRPARKSDRLAGWQEKLAHSKQRYADVLRLMDERDAIYNGTYTVDGAHGQHSGPAAKRAKTVYNMAYELIESQIDSSIPAPRVTAKRAADAKLAAMIEDYLRAMLDELPFEELNDRDERNTYNQGGDYWLVEWDMSRHTHTSRGGLHVEVLHPRQVIPQDGVSELSDMDYFFVQKAVTRKAVKERYGVELPTDGEDDPAVRGADASVAEDMVTLTVAYYKNARGGYGRYAFAGDTELEDEPDYQARQLDRCKGCGAVWSAGQKKCPACGGAAHEKRREEHEAVTEPILLPDGGVVEPMSPVRDEWGEVVMQAVPEAVRDSATGELILDMDGQMVMTSRMEPEMGPTRLPAYQPQMLPVVLRRNVSKFGSLLGSSDIDVLRPQQDAVKKLETSMMEKLLGGGSAITLPRGLNVELSDANLKVIRVNDPSEKSLIDVVNLQPNVSFDMSAIADQYSKAKSALGITDSFQGKPDSTAQSGKAKEIQAIQSAGRLDSKRVMKKAAYQRLFELMFRFTLAYADEPVQFKATGEDGGEIYTTFDRHHFLRQDEAGEWYWNDEFLFSVDATGGLAQNRETMWQEIQDKYTAGALGDPAGMDAKLLFWTMMEQMQYPLAKAAKAALTAQQEKMEAEQAAGMAEGAGGLSAGQTAAPAAEAGVPGLDALPPELLAGLMGGNGNAL